MKFALFYEIPVPPPFTRERENAAFNNTIEQAVLRGDPDEVTRAAKEYEAAGVDMLLCLINPWNISHEDCVQTIELMGRYVIPEFEK
jgi:hypothetical protein